MATFKEFMKMYQIRKDDKITKPTHTRIGDSKLKIYGGSYHIPRDKMSEFYKLYYDRVFVENILEYYTEKQYGYCMAIDLDFRYDSNVVERIHTKNHIQDIVVLYLDKIKEFYIIESNVSFPIMVFEKDHVNQLEDKTFTKDGIHIIVGLQVDFETQQLIRNEVLKEISDILDIPKINKWDSVFDESVTKGSTNWQLIGSRKPKNERYKLTYLYENEIDPEDNEIMSKLTFEKSKETQS